PGLLLTCAKSATAATTDAIGYTQEFLKKYPGHRFGPEVLATLAALLNKAARAGAGARDFGGADLIGPVGGGQGRIMLYHGSPEKAQDRVDRTGPRGRGGRRLRRLPEGPRRRRARSLPQAGDPEANRPRTRRVRRRARLPRGLGQRQWRVRPLGA